MRNECSRLARRARDLEAQIEEMQRDSPFHSRSPSGWNRLFEDHQALRAQVFSSLLFFFFKFFFSSNLETKEQDATLSLPI